MKKLTVFLLIIMLLVPKCVFADAYNIPVLLYHMVEKEEVGLDVIVSITPEQLRTHLQTIRENGYTTITYTDYYNYITKGTRLPKKPILITFDDGYTNNYEYLFPLLKEFKMKATIFVVTSTVGTTPGEYPHFTWEQAREMQDSGYVDIQSHTHTHADMTSLTLEQVKYELRMSRFLIEKNLGKKCEFLAYPYGFYNDDVLQIATDAGFLITSQVANDISSTATGKIEPVKRITTWGSLTREQLLDLIK